MRGAVEPDGLQTTTNAAADVDALLSPAPSETINTTTGEILPAEVAQGSEPQAAQTISKR